MGRPIDEGDLSEIDRHHGRAELGFLFARALWGKGYGTEAAEALVELGFGELGPARLWTPLYAGNEGSRHILERLGFSYEGTLKGQAVRDGERRDCLLYGRRREGNIAGGRNGVGE